MFIMFACVLMYVIIGYEVSEIVFYLGYAIAHLIKKRREEHGTKQKEQ